MSFSVVIIAVGVGLIAGAAAFLIFYDEYSRHFFSDRQQPAKAALGAALVGFAFFAVMALVIMAFFFRAFSWRLDRRRSGG
jgi:hypothetical protein